MSLSTAVITKILTNVQTYTVPPSPYNLGFWIDSPSTTVCGILSCSDTAKTFATSGHNAACCGSTSCTVQTQGCIGSNTIVNGNVATKCPSGQYCNRYDVYNNNLPSSSFVASYYFCYPEQDGPVAAYQTVIIASPYTTQALVTVTASIPTTISTVISSTAIPASTSASTIPLSSTTPASTSTSILSSATPARSSSSSTFTSSQSSIQASSRPTQTSSLVSSLSSALDSTSISSISGASQITSLPVSVASVVNEQQAGSSDSPAPPTITNDSPSKSWIAGAVIGPLVGVALIGALAWFLLRKPKQYGYARPSMMNTSTVDGLEPSMFPAVNEKGFNESSRTLMR